MFCLPLLIAHVHVGTPLKVQNLLFGTEDHFKSVVGQRTSPPKEPGIRFAHPGYYEVWIDSPGPGMKHLRLGLGRLEDYKGFLTDLGLDASHASKHPITVPVSPIPLYRNKFGLTGVKGLPASPKGSWSVTFTEYAVADHAKLRTLKPQIIAQPVGEGRNKLIRSAYDWWSELDFTRS